MKITYTEAAVHRMSRYIYSTFAPTFVSPTYDELPDRIKGELSFRALRLLGELIPLLEITDAPTPPPA